MHSPVAAAAAARGAGGAAVRGGVGGWVLVEDADGPVGIPAEGRAA